jgi:hypothetical protein
MPEYVLIIIVGLIGLLAGYLARGTRLAGWPRKIPSTAPPPADPKPAGPTPAGQEHARMPAPPPIPHAASPQPDAVRPTAGTTNPPAVPGPSAVPGASALRVAKEVLDVADHLDNGELALRLIEAAVLLPGVSAVRPEQGDGFQPRLHEWAGNQITDESARWNTVAQTLVPGAITSERTLLRPAQVIVFESPEQS